MFSQHACIKVGAAAGVLRLTVQESIWGSPGDAIWISGSATDNVIRAHLLHSSGGACLRVDSGSADVVAHTLFTNRTGSAAIVVSSGSGSSTLKAYEVHSQLKPPVYFDAQTYAKLTILGARLKNTGSGSSGRAVDIGSNASDSVRLATCALIASGDYSICAATANTRVHFLNGCVANNRPNNISPYGGAWTFDNYLT
jgi:hypothetical protein